MGENSVAAHRASVAMLLQSALWGPREGTQAGLLRCPQADPRDGFMTRPAGPGLYPTGPDEIVPSVPALGHPHRPS